MSIRTWVRLLSATLGVGALAGASQLGVAYGLGIVRLTRVVDVTTRDQWTAQLAWVAWFAMTAAVVGALVGERLLPAWASSPPPPSAGRPASHSDELGIGTVIGLAVAAGVGAAIVVPLTMQPARTAQIAGVHPVFVIGVCAGLGALVGIFAAIAALLKPVSRWSLTAVSLATWAIAIVSVAPSLSPDDPLPAVRLGVFDAAYLSPQGAQRMALFTMPVLALITGALLGWAARRRELPTLTIALAGLPGPALLTLAYLIAGPGAGSERYEVVPYWAAMTATGAGVLGSVLAAVLRRMPADESDGSGDTPADGTGETKPPLPRRPDEPESAIAKAGGPPAGDEELAAAARGGSGTSGSGSSAPGISGSAAPGSGTSGSGTSGSGTSRSGTSGSGTSGSGTSGSGTSRSGARGRSGDKPTAAGTEAPDTADHGIPGQRDSSAVAPTTGRRSSSDTSAPWGPAAGGPQSLGMASVSPFSGPSLGTLGPTGMPDPTGPTGAHVTGPASTHTAGTTGTAAPLGGGLGGPAVTSPHSVGLDAAGARTASADQPADSAATGSRRPDFFSGTRSASTPSTGRSFRPSSWRRSSRKSGVADPFATPTKDLPPLAADEQPASDQQQPGGVAVGDYAMGELPPFNGFARGTVNPGKAGPESTAPETTAPGIATPSGAGAAATRPTTPGFTPPTSPGTTTPGTTNPRLPAPGTSSARATAPRAGTTVPGFGSPATGQAPHTAAESAPYVPAPATSPLTPDILHPGSSATPSVGLPRSTTHSTGAREDRSAGLREDRPGRHDRGADPEPAKPKTKRWGRGRTKTTDPDPTPAATPTSAPTPTPDDRPAAGTPLVPEPPAVSAPLPHPTPITPPIATPTPVQGSDKRRPPKQKRGDDDYVDWVSGLGGGQ